MSNSDEVRLGSELPGVGSASQEPATAIPGNRLLGRWKTTDIYFQSLGMMAERRGRFVSPDQDIVE